MLTEAIIFSWRKLHWPTEPPSWNLLGFHYLPVCLAAWFLWRFWRFTLVPRLRPHDPVVLPYIIPLVGHTLSFLWNPDKLLVCGENNFPGDAPFALFIAGTRYIVLRTHDDIKAVWNDTKSLSFDEYIQAVSKGFGIPSAHYALAFIHNPAQLWKGDEKDTPYFVKENPSKKRFINLQEGWMKDGLQPGAKMDAVSKLFLENITQNIPKYLSDPRILEESKNGRDGQVVSLYKWGRYVLTDAGTKAFLGTEIFDIDPDFIQHYIDWENLSWKIPLQYPGFLSRDMQRAQEALFQTIMKYYSSDSTERPNLNWLFNRMQSEERKLGFTLHDTAAVALIMLWGIHLNTYRMLFWTMTHILSTPSLTRIIRDETNLAFNSDNERFTMSLLADECPRLTATWNEILRLYASSAVIRTCISPTTISSKTIHVGDRLLGQFRPMHLSNSIWGNDASEFDEQRWLKDGGIKKPKGFYPFGGGHMQCPGRTLAKHEVFLFVATVLRKYDIEPVGEKVESLQKGNVGGKEREYGWVVPDVSDKHVLATLDPDEDFLINIKERIR